jgi:hypothetical protein
VSRAFEELARATTPMGDITLRRRLEPTLQIDVFEVILDGAGLMSSLFTDGEVALARLGLAAVGADAIDVVVGGLGLGFTARTVLDDPRVRSLHVVDTVQPVIDWHQRHLIPGSRELVEDGRCRLMHGDFFELMAHDPPMLAGGLPDRFDAVLVDIGSGRSAATCGRMVCSRCGPTTHPTTAWSTCCTPCSQPRPRTS